MFRTTLQEFGWEGPAMKWFSNIKRFLNGEELDEMVAEVKRSTQETCDKIDKLLERAQMDGETLWFEHKKNGKEEGHVR